MKISTREIDRILLDFSEDQLSRALLETRMDKNHDALYLHLPNQTLVYDANATRAMGQPVWYRLTSSIVGNSRYLARNFVWVYDQWTFGDPSAARHGYFTDTLSTHYGQTIGWEFDTQIIYNEGRGAIFHELELVGLPGRVPLGIDPTIWTSYSTDGETFSQEKPIRAGKQGQRNKRIVWLQQGPLRNYRIQHFRGTSDAHIPIARLEAQVEALAV